MPVEVAGVEPAPVVFHRQKHSLFFAVNCHARFAGLRVFDDIIKAFLRNAVNIYLAVFGEQTVWQRDVGKYLEAR